MFKSYDDILEELEKEMRRVSDDMLFHIYKMSGTAGDVWSPRIDIYETEDEIIVKVCAAGLEPGQMELTISGDNRLLTLRGMRTERDEDKSKRIRYHQLEVYYGPFERIVTLPHDVPLDRDKLTASYSDGFLKVILPKVKKKDPLPNKIEIVE
ncbi:MAG: Hsp20/alpha crystallin family protein [Armatimonadota bacterium]